MALCECVECLLCLCAPASVRSNDDDPSAMALRHPHTEGGFCGVASHNSHDMAIRTKARISYAVNTIIPESD